MTEKSKKNGAEGLAAMSLKALGLVDTRQLTHRDPREQFGRRGGFRGRGRGRGAASTRGKKRLRTVLRQESRKGGSKKRKIDASDKQNTPNKGAKAQHALQGKKRHSSGHTAHAHASSTSSTSTDAKSVSKSKVYSFFHCVV